MRPSPLMPLGNPSRFFSFCEGTQYRFPCFPPRLIPLRCSRGLSHEFATSSRIPKVPNWRYIWSRDVFRDISDVAKSKGFLWSSPLPPHQSSSPTSSRIGPPESRKANGPRRSARAPLQTGVNELTPLRCPTGRCNSPSRKPMSDLIFRGAGTSVPVGVETC